MKIFQINVCGNQSTGRIACNLSNALTQQGHESLFAYSRNSLSSDVPSYKIGNTAGIYLHIALSRLTDRAGFYCAGATKKLINKIREFSPDIIHLHNIHGYYLHVGMLFEFLREYGRPVVWTLHDCWGFTGHCCFTGYRCGDIDMVCEKWLTECSECVQKKEYPASWLLDQSKRSFHDKKKLFTSLKSAVLVTPSKWLAEPVSKSFLNCYPIKVINNGIDLCTFHPTESDFRERYNIGDRKLILGVASPWSSRKGLNDFVRLSFMLDDSYKIVLIGLDDAQLSEIPESIIGIKRTDSAKQLAEIYTAADLFVNPTHQDNFPTVNIEALACGTPVITFDSGGSGEIADDTCGAAVPCGDVDALLEKIRNFSASKEACLARAQSYSTEKFCAQYLEIYKSLIG